MDKMNQEIHNEENKNTDNHKSFNVVFSIIISTNQDGSITRSLFRDDKMLYSEFFASSAAWVFGGGNPVLDLFEKRFLLTPKKREDISSYRCHIGNSGKGIRRVLSKFLNLQLKFFNRLFKYRFFAGETSNS